MANVQLAVAGDETTQVILSVPGVQGPAGSNLPPSGTTHQLLYKQSNTDYDTAWKLITNDNVDAAAAIAGTKISPNFGSQNVLTTGTSTAASFIPTSSGVPTNGLYLPSANNVALSTSGTGRLFVDASGRVGIGTAGASGLFHVANTGTAGTTADNLSVFFSSANRNATVNIIAKNTESSILNLGDSDSSSVGRIVYEHASNYMAFDVNTSECLRITSTGTVNIKGAGTAGSTQAVSFNGSAPVNSLVLTSAGRVGIGTTGPNAPLETAGANGTISIFRTNNATAANNAGGGFDAAASATASSRNAIMWLDADGANFAGSDYFYIQKNGNSGSVQIIQQSNAAMEFHTNGSPRAQIDSSGRLLVGTSSDSGGALLQVNGNRIRVATAKTPASASDTGTAGEICWDASYIYVCTATNTWKRAALSTW